MPKTPSDDVPNPTGDLRPERLGEPLSAEQDESSALRETFLAYVPPEVGSALATVASFVYNSAMEAGTLAPAGGYCRFELEALARELRYVEGRMSALSAVGEHTTLTEDDQAVIAAARAGVVLIREALVKLTASGVWG